MSDEESSDDDYDYDESNAGRKRFPIHDCCEFGDVEALKVRRSLCAGCWGERLLLRVRFLAVVVGPHDILVVL
jgi:hypothetical protein